MSDDALLEQIGDLYEAALEPERLYSAASCVWQTQDADKGSVHLIDSRQRFVQRVATTANFDQRAIEDYDAHYYNRNSWYLALKTRGLPHVIRGEEVISDADLTRSEFGSDWCRRVGVFYLVGGMHPVTNGMALATAAYRDRTEGGFSEEEKRRFSIVVRHLARAFQIAARLGVLAERQGFCLELLDELDLGVVFLDEIGRVEFLNGVAERIANRRRWLILRGGRLSPVLHSDASNLARAIRAATRTGLGAGLSPGEVLRLGDPQGGTLPVLVAPLRLSPGLLPRRSVAIVLFSDPDRRNALDGRKLARTLGLSPTEGAVVAALVAGKSLMQYAEEAGVSVNTAKTQLAAVFDKTGHSRQSALVAAVAGHAVARLAARPRVD